MTGDAPTPALEEPEQRSDAGDEPVRARRAGLLTDIRSIGLRGLRAAWRDPEAVIPPIFVGAFFFAINVGSLQSLAESTDPGFDFKAFQLSTAIVLTVTGITRAYGLTLDIQNGYFDKLALSPVRRPALLLGHMIADFVLAMGLAAAVSLVAMAVGVRFETGVAGFAAYLVFAGLWSVAYAGVPYALALKTGNPTVVNQSFLVFFPFAFLTSALVPEEALTGWLATVAKFNPVTYLLRGMRSLVSEGWDIVPIAQGLAAVVGVGLASHTVAFFALRGRTNAK
ncbi:MAG: ABC transporter permease [Actinomycetia bacterium]|nr:ABC transporter permease [Actinomycetes bacterium]